MPIVYVQAVHDGSVSVGCVNSPLDLKRLTARGPVWAWYSMVDEDATKFLTICNEAKVRCGGEATAIDVICATAQRTELFPQPVIGWRTKVGEEPLKADAAAAILRSLTFYDEGEQVSMGILCNRARKYTHSMMRSAAADLARAGKVRLHVSTHPNSKKIITKLSLP